METLTKDVERMAGAFAEQTMEERFKEWAPRVILHEKQAKQEREKNAGPREVKLDEGDRSDEEKKFIKAVAEKPEEDESEKKPSVKSTADKDAAKPTEQKLGAKPSEKPAASEPPVEPLSGDRHWQAVEGKVNFTKEEANDHWDRVGSRAGVALDYVNQHPQKAQIEQGLRGFFDTSTPGGQLFFRDFSTALAEVPNPGEVLRHIALQGEDRNWLRSNVKDWKGLRAAIQAVSKHYAAAAPAPKPRAPKPPSEVGGRGAAGDDDRTNGEMSFRELSRRMEQRYTHAAR